MILPEIPTLDRELQHSRETGTKIFLRVDARRRQADVDRRLKVAIYSSALIVKRTDGDIRPCSYSYTQNGVHTLKDKALHNYQPQHGSNVSATRLVFARARRSHFVEIKLTLVQYEPADSGRLKL